MADIRTITLPNSNTYNFRDTRLDSLKTGLPTLRGVSITLANAAVKVVTLYESEEHSDGQPLTPGSLHVITFTYGNTYTSGALYLKAAGSNDEIKIYCGNRDTSSSVHLTWEAGDTLTFIYDKSGNTNSMIYICRDSAVSPSAISASDITAAVIAGWGTSIVNADSTQY